MGLHFSNPDLIYLLFAFLALGVFIAFTGITQLLSYSETQGDARNRRMRMLSKGASRAEIKALLRPDLRSGALGDLSMAGRIRKALGQSGLGISTAQFLVFCALLTLGAGIAGAQFFALPLALAAAIVVGVAVPICCVVAARKKRMDAMINQLPDALDLLARGLKVGHPLNTSIGAVAEEMEDPVASEFGLIFDQVSYGDDLPDAFQEFAERVDLEDVHYLSSSISIQHGTGGDLARMIHTLAQVVRGRIAMRRRIKALTAEGRMTAWFLSILPFVIYIMTSASSPGYYSGVADDPLFRSMVVLIAAMTVLNAIVLWKLVNFRI